MPIFRFRCGRWSRYAANSSGSGRTWSLCTRTHSQNGLPGVAFSRKFRPQSHRTKIYSTQRSPFYFLIFFFFLYHAPPLVPLRSLPATDRGEASAVKHPPLRNVWLSKLSKMSRRMEFSATGDDYCKTNIYTLIQNCSIWHSILLNPKFLMHW